VSLSLVGDGERFDLLSFVSLSLVGDGERFDRLGEGDLKKINENCHKIFYA
jgi:hypothetical protein